MLVPRSDPPRPASEAVAIDRFRLMYSPIMEMHAFVDPRTHPSPSASRTPAEQQRFGPWLDRFERRVHRNVAVVAMANKLARIAWAVLARVTPYRAPFDDAAYLQRVHPHEACRDEPLEREIGSTRGAAQPGAAADTEQPS